MTPKRFEIWRLHPDRGQAPKASGPLVLVLQSERVGHLKSIIVAPMNDTDLDAAVPQLTPLIDVDGKRFVLLTPFLSAIDRSDLAERIGDAGPYDYEITRALDRLFHGT